MSHRSKFGNNWQDIVCTGVGYDALMNHLEKEFAIENLLFISEVCIYINVTKKKYKI